LFFAGDTAGRAGVGDGDGFCPNAIGAGDVLNDSVVFPLTLALALAMAKQFDHRPKTHANAQVLMAAD
jgi:hypothetical protein